VFPAASLLSAVEVELLARDIEKLTTVVKKPFEFIGDDGKRTFYTSPEQVTADIESLFIKAAKAKKAAKYAAHDRLRDKATQIYHKHLKKVLQVAENEVLKNISAQKDALESVLNAREAGSAQCPDPTVKAALGRSVEGLSPKELEPALLVNGEPKTGGSSHAEIMTKLGTAEALRSFSEDKNHIFVTKSGEQFTREQAAKALGRGGLLHSHELAALKVQASAPVGHEFYGNQWTKEAFEAATKPLRKKLMLGDQVAFLNEKGQVKVGSLGFRTTEGKAKVDSGDEKHEVELSKLRHPESAHLLKEFKKVKASQPTIKATAPASALINFDLKSFAGSFLDAMGQAAKEAWKVTHSGLLTELGVGQTETPEGLVNDFIERRENKISGCPENIWEQVDRSIREGIDGGETMQELRDRVSEEFDGIEEGRAMLVAQTESQCLYGTAQADAIERAGFATKRWVSMDDDLVRPSHAECEADGEIPIDEAFSNGLMYPGDSEGDAGEVCNCRCYLAAGIQDEDEEGEE
jgi:hypothetical protein